MATELVGVQLLFNGVAAPLLRVGADFVDAVVPQSVDLARPARVETRRNGESLRRQ